MKVNADLLAGQPFLKGLSAHQLKMLADNAMIAEFKTDELIFEDGSPANRFYLLLSGEVALESPCPKCGDERTVTTVETIGAGAVLGWSWMFPPYYAHFNARAVSPIKAIFFYGTRLREQCENDHDFGYELMKRITETFVERLQIMREQLAKSNRAL